MNNPVGDGQNGVDDATFDETPDPRRRVKLYVLNDDRQWDDRGTGHVTSIYSERLEGTALLVRSETDGSLLLESKIELDTAYQKQQETLVVWSEGDKYDLALSFQGKAGCDEIWEKICQVQGKDPSVDITQEVLDSDDDRFDLDDSTSALELPPCELAHLEEIAHLCSTSLASLKQRDKLGSAVENSNYISRLLNLFHTCEDLENIEGLHQLYEIVKSLFLLNKNSLLDILLTEDNLMDVVGCLEYDPALAERKKHRDFLNTKTCFKEVIPITNKDLKAKIHQTYRVSYIHDVIFPAPSILEENMLSALASFIFFNKVEIVNLVQEDERFLRQLFQLLTDDETDDDKRRDIVLFLKEFCFFSQTLQQASREAFFKTLSKYGILESLERILTLDDTGIKSAAVDIFSYIVEFSPSMVREFIMQESKTQEDDDLLINLVIEQMIGDSDPELGGAFQLLGVIRILLDPENMMAAAAARGTEKAEFLGFFYKHSMHVLCAPLLANTADGKPSKDDYVTAVQLNLLLELLCFCVEHHALHARSYVIHRNLLARVLVLLKSRHTFLALTAIRFMRRLIGCREEHFTEYLIKNHLFKPVVQCFVRNGEKYNLLNSAIIEIFEFIKSEDIKPLLKHVVENHYTAFEHVNYVPTFKLLRHRYDQQVDRERTSARPHAASTLEMVVPVPDEVEDDEIWFEEDEPAPNMYYEPNMLVTKSLEEEFDLHMLPLRNRESEETELENPWVPRRNRNFNINIKSTLTPQGLSQRPSQQTAPAPGSPLPTNNKVCPLQVAVGGTVETNTSSMPTSSSATTTVSTMSTVTDSAEVSSTADAVQGSNGNVQSTTEADSSGLPQVSNSSASPPLKASANKSDDAQPSAAVVKKPGWPGLVAYEPDSDEDSDGSEEENTGVACQPANSSEVSSQSPGCSTSQLGECAVSNQASESDKPNQSEVTGSDESDKESDKPNQSEVTAVSQSPKTDDSVRTDVASCAEENVQCKSEASSSKPSQSDVSVIGTSDEPDAKKPRLDSSEIE